MKRMIMLLLILCLLPTAALAVNPAEFSGLGRSSLSFVQAGATIYGVNGNLVLDEMVYDTYSQICYRPITYIKHYDSGETETRMEAVALVEVIYTYYYGQNEAKQYVMAGANPEPTLAPIEPALYAVSATHIADTYCNPVQLPNFAGYAYYFSGGYFTMDYYDVIHLDEDDNIIRKELNVGQIIAYSCTFTIP